MLINKLLVFLNISGSNFRIENVKHNLMTTIQPSLILDEVNNLVSYSCNEGTGKENTFVSLHKGIIKIYFEAKKVEIDYSKNLISAEIPVSATEYTMVSFEYQDLESFLKSCIKKDKRSLTFYQNVLTYYNGLKVA